MAKFPDFRPVSAGAHDSDDAEIPRRSPKCDRPRWPRSADPYPSRRPVIRARSRRMPEFARPGRETKPMAGRAGSRSGPIFRIPNSVAYETNPSSGRTAATLGNETNPTANWASSHAAYCDPLPREPNPPAGWARRPARWTLNRGEPNEPNGGMRKLDKFIQPSRPSSPRASPWL